MRTLTWLLTPWLAAALSACTRGEAPGTGSAGPAAHERATKTSPVPDPFKLGPCPTTARKGDFVLCPPREWVDKAVESKTPQNQTFAFLGARMLRPGPRQSTVRSLTGREMQLPNCLIIPIRPDDRATPGDIVLTHWQSGSGMQRAVVVEGGSPEAPRVRYLDVDLDNPGGAGARAEACKPGTFHKLQHPWAPGTSVAARGALWVRTYSMEGLSSTGMRVPTALALSGGW